ncbi:MAG: alpha,alpha-trehalose-phosphate synthase (UDP-forming) [Acidimicrobiales bacterium]
MADVVVVSNRGPLSFRLAGEEPVLAGTGGGLAGTLRRLLAGSGATWVASAMGEADRRAAAAGMMSLDGLKIVTVEPDRDLYRMAYDVVSNATLWFCHHHLFDLPRRPRLDRRWLEAWDAYRTFNRLFAESVAAEAAEGASVLVQDYHLALVGGMLAAERPDLRTVHFSHTPFADPSVLRCLPAAAAGQLLAGMAGFGACGFHTGRWEAAFRAAFADPALAGQAGTAAPPITFVAPLGPSPDVVVAQAASPPVVASRAELDRRVGDRRLIVRVDRVELSKNLLRGLWAFEELIETRPAWRGRVTMLALAYPSRQGLPEYLAYRTEVEHTAARINEVWADDGWTPIVLDVADDHDRSMAALSRYDVLLVNPVRDGMNLVAKEGPLVNTTDGVVVLSREAGAWEELAPAAIEVNPFDISGTADALDLALSMPAAERAARAGALRKIVLGQTAADWLHRQLEVASSLDPAAG